MLAACKELMAVSHVSHSIKTSGRNDEKMYSSQTDVIFVATDALVRIYEDDLIAKRNVTAMYCPYAFDLSCPNQLTVNQNAHVFRLSSILARQKMRMK